MHNNTEYPRLYSQGIRLLVIVVDPLRGGCGKVIIKKVAKIAQFG